MYVSQALDPDCHFLSIIKGIMGKWSIRTGLPVCSRNVGVKKMKKSYIQNQKELVTHLKKTHLLLYLKVQMNVVLASLDTTVVLNAIVTAGKTVLKMVPVSVSYCGMDQPARLSWVSTVRYFTPLTSASL